MALKLGAYTACLHDRPLAEALEVLKGNGLTSVEVNTGGFIPSPHCHVDLLLSSEQARADYLGEFSSRGMELTGLNCNGNPLNPLPGVGPKHADDMRRSIELAGALGINNIVCMSGTPGSDPDAKYPSWVVNPWDGVYMDVLDYQWDVAAKFWTEIDGLARANNTRMAIEMHPHNLVFSPVTLKKLCDMVGAGNVGAEMDPSHLMWQGMDIVACIRWLGPLVFHAAAKDAAITPGVDIRGVLDTSFDPGANGPVNALAIQADGRMLVGGQFTLLGGGGPGTIPRSNFGRLNADGSLDFSFNAGASGAVYAVAVQADGKILVGGNFTLLGGGTGNTPRTYLGRLNADGSLDASFFPGANAPITAVAVQPDGKIVVGGQFTMLGGGGIGTTPRSHLARLNADGSLDTTFNPGADGTVNALALRPDGKILVGGAFTTLGGGGSGTTTRNDLGRLNADGSLDLSFDPGANGSVNSLALQPDGWILVGGQFTMLGGGGTGTTPRNRIARLDADGMIDPSLNPGADNSVLALASQTDGKIVVGGAFTTLGGGGSGTTARNYLGRLNRDGSLETSLYPGTNSDVTALAVQPDGKILLGGAFTRLGGGGTGTTARSNLGRLNADGSLDALFTPGADQYTETLAVQPDGKILVGGAFTTLAGVARHRLGRLNADGSLDASFNPGANGVVYTLALQPDGKIVVAGDFTTLGGGGTGTPTRNHIGRLNADGSLDAAFDPGANGVVNAVALQPDGKILVGGGFTTLGGGGTGTTGRIRIARLNADGSLDAPFDPGANGVVYTLAPQPDGKVLVGGDFTMLGGGGSGTTPRSRLGRLNPDGSLDASFDPGASAIPQALTVQSDGKILVGGFFTTLGGGGTGLMPRSQIGRLNADGSIDTSFDPGANNYVLTLAVQSDGKVLIGGAFTMLGGGGSGTTVRTSFGRLTNTDAAIQSLAVASGGGVITWSRSGAGPEVWRTTFESSTDGGATYTSLGSGARIAGGWQMSGLSLPVNQNLLIRARGYYQTGYFGGSASIVESVRNVFVFAAPPTMVTGAATAIALTGVTLNGTANPNGFATAGKFEYGLTPDYAAPSTTPAQGLGSGTAPTAIGGGAITGLTCNTLYHFRAVGTNAAATVNGGDATFTTAACPPTVVTGTAGAIGLTSATLNGTANPNGTATTGNFEYGTTIGYGSTTPTQNLGSGSLVALIGGGALTNLTCSTLYHFRAVAANVAAGVSGLDATLTTAACQPPVIATQPTNQTVVVGDTVSFTATASGTPAPTVQWQSSTAGGSTFSNIAGATSTAYAFTPVPADNGRQYRAVFSNVSGVATTSAATLTVNAAISAPSMTTHPSNQTASPGGVASFSASAGGSPAAVRWQVSRNGGSTFTDIDNANSSTYSFTAVPADNGSQFRAVFTNSAGAATSNAAALTVTMPAMSVDRTSLVFGASSSGTALVSKTAAQSVRLIQAGAGPVTWTATANQPWLTVSPVSGSGSGDLTIGVAFAPGLTATQTGSITLTFLGAGNSTVPIGATLNVATGSAAPFGAFDTPTDGTPGITGSVAVTGWALDDIDVTGVRVLRDPVAGETPGQLVFIGNAVFIEGARPDVQTAYAALPRNARAGWGYLMLTNFLPNHGNGTFTLRAFADDADGHSFPLGSKTITCTNATATLPFGAIDTPEQGQTIGGAVINFGWVLAAQPTASGLFVPFDGSTVQVFVDSLPIGPLTSYNNARTDIQAFFPGYANTDGAVGAKVIDTTVLTNGVHTIFWLATDNTGATAGIGSRYFRVSNGTSLIAAPVRASAVASGAAIAVVHGLDANAAADVVVQDADGVRRIRAAPLERVAITLDSTPGEAAYRGYELIDGESMPLPIGSHLDARTGEFVWMPGLAFGGTHRLMFIRAADGREERILVDVTIGPTPAIGK